MKVLQKAILICLILGLASCATATRKEPKTAQAAPSTKPVEPTIDPKSDTVLEAPVTAQPKATEEPVLRNTATEKRAEQPAPSKKIEIEVNHEPKTEKVEVKQATPRVETQGSNTQTGEENIVDQILHKVNTFVRIGREVLGSLSKEYPSETEEKLRNTEEEL